MLENFLDIARSQIGYKEGKNNDTKYGKWYGMNNNPWCAMFVSWCANEVGILDKKIPKYASSTAGYKWFKEKDLITKEPKAGYVGFLMASKTSQTANHTFIVESVNGNEIHTIEGNLDDSVKRYVRTLDEPLKFGIIEFEDLSVIRYVDNVDYEGLNVRYLDNNAKTGVVLEVGTQIRVLKEENEKALVSDKTYVYKKYLSKNYPSNVKSVFTGNNTTLNVRKSPSILGKKIATLKNGTKVKVYETKGSWSKISADSNAWCSSKYLK